MIIVGSKKLVKTRLGEARWWLGLKGSKYRGQSRLGGSTL